MRLALVGLASDALEGGYECTHRPFARAPQPGAWTRSSRTGRLTVPASAGGSSSSSSTAALRAAA